MAVSYDKYYQTEDLFGKPYPELLEFMSEYPKDLNVLDLGCGQGRDAVALARLGYSVTGIDSSKVGINQMKRIGEAENLNLIGLVGDIYDFDNFVEYDIILLDSMFHFTIKDKKREIGLLKIIFSQIKNGSLIIVCIQDSGKKVQILNQTIESATEHIRLIDKKFKYIFKDQESNHTSESPYRMIVVKKQ
ncbi:MAG: methyltransferase domain-containing protein [Balneolaceae bacterium]